ncbi:MAG: hypothetical protein ABI947_01870 [Chloroflexota bacterium]
MSSRPASGRNSLFDNRYRLDQSYPRGRSGETVRAYDSLNSDQPVVIKRPALQDAAPMRAGQEQSILNEKRVLERLAGHPAVPAVLHGGTFRGGGQTYQYIALEWVQGESVESLVHDLAAHGEHLPELETLVIFDALLDAIQTAHDRKIVHNDIDAASLFWDRDQYRLKVIGWSSATFIDSEGGLSSANRATDIAQIGQALYFVLSGGRTDIAADLGSDVSPKLKTIIERASNAETGKRYTSVAKLRQDLAELREPLEQERNTLLEPVRADLPNAENAAQLQTVRDTLLQVLAADPGYPPARALLTQIDTRLAQLTIQDNLHAIRVYMLSGNMGRALTVLGDLKTQLGNAQQPVLDFLSDAATQMQAEPIVPLAGGFSEALDALLQGDPQTAGRILITTYDARPAAHDQQYWLAEKLSLHIPEVLLLQPPLIQLQNLLADKPDLLERVRSIIGRLDLARLDKTAVTAQAVRGVYQDTVKALTTIISSLDSIDGDSGDALIAATGQRTRYAAEQILNWLDVALRNAYSDPARAADALGRAEAIDPANNSFETLRHKFDIFHDELSALQAETPTGDSSDILQFLADAQAQLTPYSNNLMEADQRFQEMFHGLDDTISAWNRVGEAVALGGRRTALEACQQAAEAVRPFNQAIAVWFDEYAHQIEQAPRVEHLSPNAAFGTALQEGWEQWDRGRGAEAQAAGERALKLAASEAERQAAQRLIALSDALNTWLANDGPLNPKRSEQTAAQVNALFSPQEEAIRRTFSKQMPDAPIYLRAMARGIVAPLREASAAAVRGLFFDYVLRGMLVLQQDNAEAAEFWREAALRTLGSARTHPAYLTLDIAITRRSLILEAVDALNNIKHVSDLPSVRQAVRAPLAASQLEAPAQAIDGIDEALAQWAQGDFRKARQSLDSAAERITFAEATLGQDLSPFKTWLQDLAASAGVVQQARHTIEQIALVPADDPDPAVIEMHQKIIEITRRDLGEAYTPVMRQWRDTYNTIRDLYVDEKLTKAEKLRLLDDYAESTALENHPALPIMRHWDELIQRLPDPQPAYVVPSIPLGSLDRTISSVESADDESPTQVSEHEIENASDESLPATDAPLPARRGSPALLVIGVLVLIAVVVVVGVLWFLGPPPPTTTVVVTSTDSSNGVAVAGGATMTPSNTIEPPTATIAPTNTEEPTATPPTLPPTITPVVPTPTPPTTQSSIATDGPTLPLGSPTTLPVGVGPRSSAIPTNSTLQPPTFVPTANTGDYDMLKSLETLPTAKITWNKDWFGPAGDGWQLGTEAFRTNGPPLVVRLGPDVMTPLIGVDAARKLTRVDADLELTGYDKSLLPTGQVFFGIGVESLQGPRAAVQAVLVQANLLRLGVNLNGQFRPKTDIPVTTAAFAVSIKRNADSTLSLFVNGQLLGTTGASFAAGTPVNIYLYTSAGSVVVKITSLKIHLE